VGLARAPFVVHEVIVGFSERGRIGVGATGMFVLNVLDEVCEPLLVAVHEETGSKVCILRPGLSQVHLIVCGSVDVYSDVLEDCFNSSTLHAYLTFHPFGCGDVVFKLLEIVVSGRSLRLGVLEYTGFRIKQGMICILSSRSYTAG
jgi:hypothetical protein